MPPTVLSVYAWGHLEDAVHDMPDMPAAELFTRFFAWTRPQGTAP